MYFTQEDYRKIEKWLQARSVKDTEFQEANPLAGTEEVAIVQNGKNRIVTVKDFANQLSLLGIDDFINVTSKYNAKYISLEDAIQIVPFLSRKVGQVITFLNTEGEWHIYQFRGESILQWNVATLWVDILESEIINSILPDEEDLTKTAPDASGNSYLKFKNKDYNNVEFSGLGRVFVRKNIKTLQDPNTLITRKINYLSQEQIADENTIYIIQYNHDLNGQTIIIPENSILFFEGGTITNGVIEGQNTNIVAGKNVIFGIGTTITGTWNITDIYDYWFEFNSASGDNFIANDIIKNILALTSDTVSNVVHFDADRTYYFELPYKGRTNLGDDVRPNYWKLNTEEYAFLRIFTGVTSNTHLIFNNTLQMIPTNQGAYFIFHIESKENIQISGTGTINADALNHKYTDPFAGTLYYGEWGHIFNFRSCNNIVIKDVTLAYAFGDAIGLGNVGLNIDGNKGCLAATKNVTIDGIKVLYARRNGISLGGNNYSISNVYFEGCGSEAIRGTAPKAAIDFENDYTEIDPSGVCTNVVMSNCKFKDNAYDVSSTIRWDLGEVPTGQLVTINGCNFTAPLRLNKTRGLTFNDCHIVGISSHDNSISPWTVSEEWIFNNCNFDELNPYLVVSANDYKHQFNNCTYPEDIQCHKIFRGSLAGTRAIKFSIPKPISVGELEFVAICTNSSYSIAHLPINTTKYTIGNNTNLVDIRDIRIEARVDSYPRFSMYQQTPVFSYIDYNGDADNINIYFSLGGNITGSPLAGNTEVNIFMNSKTKYIVKEEPVSEGSTAGIYGGKWSEVSAITKTLINISDIPSTVVFPSREMYPNSTMSDLNQITNLKSQRMGTQIYVTDTSYRQPAYWDSTGLTWRTADGNRTLERSVTTTEALGTLTAKLTESDRGYRVYTSVHSSYLTWDGIQWLNEDGSLYSDVKFINKFFTIERLNNAMSNSNVTYKIVGNIDLGEGELTIASGSTLDFQGGSFSNGTLLLSNTKFKGNIKLSSITLAGTYKGNELNLNWFTDDTTLDYSANLQSLFNIAPKQSIINIGVGKYLINSQVNVTKSLTIKGNATRGYYTLGVEEFNTTLYTTEDISILNITQKLVTIDGINFQGASTTIDSTTGIRAGANPLVIYSGAANGTVRNCNFMYSHIGLQLSNSGIATIENNGFSGCNCGCRALASPDSNYVNNYFNTNSGNVEFTDANASALNGVGLFLTSSSGNTNIIGGKVEWNAKGIIVQNSMGVAITGVQFDRNKDGNLLYRQSSSSTDSSLLGHIVTGCRFLGGITSQHIYIYYWTACKFNINGNFFTKNGDTATDISTDGTPGPDTIMLIKENHASDSYQYNCTVEFTGNSYHRIINIANGVTQLGTLATSNLINILVDRNDLAYLGRLTVKTGTMDIKTYSTTFNGITVSLKKSSNVITCRVFGTSTAEIVNQSIVPDTLDVSSVLATLWQPSASTVYTNFIQSKTNNEMLVSMENGKQVDFILTFFSTNLK